MHTPIVCCISFKSKENERKNYFDSSLVPTCLKGQSHKIFDPRLFLPIKSPKVTDYHPKIFSNLVSTLPRYICCIAESRDSALYRIARGRLRAVPHSAESTRKFCIEFHVVLSSGCCHLGVVIWVLSSVCCHLCVVIWVLSSGCCHLGVVIWVLTSGCCHLGAVIWVLTSGCCHLGVVIWVLSSGCCHLGCCHLGIL
jgi:hypothetical protein